MKNRPLGAELFHADRHTHARTHTNTEQTDRRTDMMKLVVAFRNFSGSPKIDNVSDKLVLFMSDGKEYQEIATVETTRRTEDTKKFFDIVRARKL
jgi:hypothetical protein